LVVVVGAVGLGMLRTDPTGEVRVDTAGPDVADATVESVDLELPAPAGSPPAWEP